MKSFRLLAPVLLGAMVSVAGCSSSDKEEKAVLANMGAQQLYDRAKQSMEVGNFSAAAQTLSALDSRYPFGPLSHQVQLDLIYSYYKSGKNEETLATSEVVVGGFTFDPSEFGSSIGALTLYFEGLIKYEAAGASGDAILRLYDMGAPGAIGSGTLRSTLTTGGTRNTIVRAQNTLTAVSSPSATNEIYNSERVYELRLLSDGSGGPNDVSRMIWGGIKVLAS